jgi:RNA polymerase sigma-70 factor (ECF subfamily)
VSSSSDNPQATPLVSGHGVFATTHWSVVLTARNPAAPESAAALETLCRTYWYPVYAFVRRQGQSPHDAQDLTQEFFTRLLQKDYLRSAAREKGRFRTFLIFAVKRFMANEWDRARTLKRGGGETPLPLDTSIAETRYQMEPAAESNADSIYERRWALTLLDQTMTRLRKEYEAEGKSADFDHLKSFLTVDRGGIGYETIASRLGVSEGAARVAVHRLRKRFREVFREEIAQTVSSPTEIDDEVTHLVAALANDSL